MIPTWMSEVHKVKLPFVPDLERTEDKLDDPAFTFRQVVESEGKEARATYEYRSRACEGTGSESRGSSKTVGRSTRQSRVHAGKAVGRGLESDVKGANSPTLSILSNIIIGVWLVGGIMMVPGIVVLERFLRRRRLARRGEVADGMRRPPNRCAWPRSRTRRLCSVGRGARAVRLRSHPPPSSRWSVTERNHCTWAVLLVRAAA